jgi:phosphohistidine phosphatase
MDLFVLRHGEAGNRQKMIVVDAKRTLTAVGRKEIDEIAKGLLRLKIRPVHIVTSPLVRARETAEIVAKVQKSKNLEEWEELKPEGNRQQFYEKLSKLKLDSSILVVGHEPYLSTMICDMIGASGGHILLKKGGLARVRIEGFVPKVRGELRWLLSPRLLKKF